MKFHASRAKLMAVIYELTMDNMELKCHVAINIFLKSRKEAPLTRPKQELLLTVPSKFSISPLPLT